MLFHGTNISGLSTIKANSKSHSTGKTVAYFSEDRCYALICCRSRTENFVTMGRATPFENWNLQGENLLTICKGEIVYAAI